MVTEFLKNTTFTDSLLKMKKRKKKDYFVLYSKWHSYILLNPAQGVTKTQHSSSNPFALPISCP